MRFRKLGSSWVISTLNLKKKSFSTNCIQEIQLCMECIRVLMSDDQKSSCLAALWRNEKKRSVLALQSVIMLFENLYANLVYAVENAVNKFENLDFVIQGSYEYWVGFKKCICSHFVWMDACFKHACQT